MEYIDYIKRKPTMTLLQILLPAAIMFTAIYAVCKVFKLDPTRTASNDDGFIDGFIIGQLFDQD